MSKPRVLSLNAVSFSYERQRAVVIDGITLAAAQGERIAVLGESGSGKSTLVGLLSGLLKPTGGQVLLGGKDIAGIPHHERNTALVLQRPPVLVGTTVQELLSRPARRNLKALNTSHGRSSGFQPRTIREVLDSLEMGHLEHRRLTDLSGGELQRVHIARSLVWKPDFALLDEPFNSIDVQLKHSLYPLLRQHQAGCESCMILITHDPQEALLLCDRIVIMRNGKVISDSTAEELLAAPPDVGSARIIGGVATNLFNVELRRAAGSEVILDTFLGGYCGYLDDGPVRDLPSRAKAFFRWTDIRAYPASDEPSTGSPVFTACNGGATSFDNPSLYLNEDGVVYGRPLRTTDRKARLILAADSVVLYDIQTELLIGRFVFGKNTSERLE